MQLFGQHWASNMLFLHWLLADTEMTDSQLDDGVIDSQLVTATEQAEISVLWDSSWSINHEDQVNSYATEVEQQEIWGGVSDQQLLHDVTIIENSLHSVLDGTAAD